MAEPIKHDAASAVVTAGVSTVKWGLLGLAATALLGAAVVGGLGFLLGGAIIGSTTAAIAGTIGAVIGGIAGGVVGAPAAGYLAGGGALLGLLKGGSKISAENAAYKQRVEHRAELREHKHENELNAAYIEGIKAGYGEAEKDMILSMQTAAGQKPEGPLSAKVLEDRKAAQAATERHV